MSPDQEFFDRARSLDDQDELGAFRDRFVIDDPEVIYLDGNSLGRLPKRTVEVVNDLVARQWGAGLVRGWHDWFDLPQRLGAKIARLIGAEEDEVIVGDSTSVNLFKVTLAALLLDAERNTIVTDDANFPSDIYIGQGAAHLVSGQIQVVASSAEAIAGAIDKKTALVSLSHVQFKSGAIHDMAGLTGKAHENGALALWDLSHSVGAVPIDLNGSSADLAVGCTYKYLNGGPGAPAFVFVRRGLQARLQSPIWGWFGQKNPFRFDLQYSPAEGMRRFLAGTPPILSMAATEPGLDLVLEAGIERLRAKSRKQTEYLVEGIDRWLAPLGFELQTPRDPSCRGSHVSVAHPEAWRISQGLIQDRKVIPDYREPNVLRLGVTPLYTTYGELAKCLRHIAEIVREGSFTRFSDDRSGVT